MKKISEARLHGTGHQFAGLKKYLPEFVYGGIDGSVTTFAVVAGSAGAGLSIEVVLILGFANLFADGFSMSVGNYLSVKSEIDDYNLHKDVEYWEVDNLPEKEKEEIREIYQAKGFEGELLEKVVDTITANKDRWVDVMMKEELEMALPDKSPYKTAGMTFFSFVVVGLIPLLTYVFQYIGTMSSQYVFLLSCIFTSLAFIIIGFMRSYVTHRSKFKSVMETLALGALAAGVAYLVGEVFEKMLL